MQQLIEKLEELLAVHDCVVVPGLGGFIQQESEACYDPAQETFYPRSRRLSFNARLNFNDGLLTQAFQAGFGLSFAAANQRIRESVELMRLQMSEGCYVRLGQIGTMHENEDGALTFQPLGGSVLSPELFGLKAISCRDYQSQPASVGTAPSDNTRGLSLVAQWGRWAAAAAAAVLLILFFGSQPLNRTGYNVNQASVLGVDTDMLATAVVSHPDLEPAAQPLVAAVEEKSAAQPLAVAAKETPASQPQATVKAENNKRYLIVIASFPDENAARQYIERRQLKDSFPEVGVAVGAEHCRVYAAAFTSRQEAVSSLPAFRNEHPKYAKAWVLVQ